MLYYSNQTKHRVKRSIPIYPHTPRYSIIVKKLRSWINHTRQRAYEYKSKFKQSCINLNKKHISKFYENPYKITEIYAKIVALQIPVQYLNDDIGKILPPKTTALYISA